MVIRFTDRIVDNPLPHYVAENRRCEEFQASCKACVQDLTKYLDISLHRFGPSPAYLQPLLLRRRDVGPILLVDF